MDTAQLILIAAAIMLVAFLYSSVGHAGASGYIAVLTLFGFTSGFIKPTALVLNILVAAIGSYQFWRAGHFSWNFFWPFGALAVPAAAICTCRLRCSKFCSAWCCCARRCACFSAPVMRRSSHRRAVPWRSGWAQTKRAAATSGVFILVNSLAGQAGHFASGKPVPHFAWALAVAVVAGGTLGSYLGSARLPARVIQLLLGAVLVIAGAKLIVTR
jgi:uncharacterized membrane protein YfcA